MTPADCPHPTFEAQVSVNRITGGPALRFAADVRITCALCREPFRFLGPHAGLSFEHPTVSIDGLELHLPIEPELVKVLHPTARYQMPPEAP